MELQDITVLWNCKTWPFYGVARHSSFMELTVLCSCNKLFVIASGWQIHGVAINHIPLQTNGNLCELQKTVPIPGQRQHVSLRKHAYSNILKILPPKIENFQIKNSSIFYISAQNIDCGYSLESPRRGGSNEYPQSMFLNRNKKMYNPVNPSFTV